MTRLIPFLLMPLLLMACIAHENTSPIPAVLTEQTSEKLIALATQPTVPAGSLKTAQRDQREGHLKVMFVGDSITEGGDVPLTFTWAALGTAALQARGAQGDNRALGRRTLATLLDPNYLGQIKEPTDWHLGFGPRDTGDRTWVMPGVSWYQQVIAANDQGQRPSLYIVAFGINDVFEASQFKGRLNTLVARLQALPNHPSVALVTPVTPEMPSTGPQGGNAPLPVDAVHEVASAIREVATERQVVLLDVNRLWRLLTEGRDVVSGAKAAPRYSEADLLGIWPGGYDADGNGFNHPSRLGHQVTYLAVFRQFLKVLDRP